MVEQQGEMVEDGAHWEKGETGRSAGYGAANSEMEDGRVLELRVSRRPRAGDHVANVRHAGHELHGPLQAEPEAGMRHGAIAAQIEIPPVRLRVELLLAHPLFEHVQPLLALAAADDLADARHEHVHRAYRL